MKKMPQTTKDTQSRTPKTSENADLENSTRASGDDIVALILKDHEPLKALIETLKSSELEKSDKETALEEFIFLLTTHAKAEEKSLYVQMKEYEELRVESFEGDTEHAIADQLVQEINASPDDDEWNAKVKVLAELVEHHIEEEENSLLPDVSETMDASVRTGVGQMYIQLKADIEELKSKPRVKSKAPKSKNPSTDSSKPKKTI